MFTMLAVNILKNVGSSFIKNASQEAAKQVVKKGAKDVAKGVAMSAAKAGGKCVIEGVQTAVIGTTSAVTTAGLVKVYTTVTKKEPGSTEPVCNETNYYEKYNGLYDKDDDQRPDGWGTTRYIA